VRLGWRFVDIDDEIVRVCGKTIADIFALDGEERFRELESEVLGKVCREKGVVVSTGGGAIVNDSNRELMLNSGVVVCLEATPSTIYGRLLRDAEESGEQEVRPLLTVPDPQGRIEQLKASRQAFYAMADWTVHTDNLTIAEAAEEVIRGWRYVGGAESAAGDAACVVTTATESYPVFIGWGLLDQLGKRIQEAGLRGRAFIVSDDGVFPHYGESVKSILKKGRFTADSKVVPRGERSKSFDTAVGIYDWLVAGRAARGDCIVALGGGMVGDLAGFVASTFLRGMPLVQVPTSLIGMVDSAIGGKVGVDHPEGKNLIGSFYQPRLVLADVETLKSLPRRELVSGWAEVIKHAMIRDPQLLGLLEERSRELQNLDERITPEVVARSVAVKAEIVSVDEREQGIRTILNYGHTIAHGLETATGYGRFLHGEAVAVGMMGAAEISRRLGMLSGDVVERQRALLEGFGLPAGCSGIDIDGVMRAMELDKKVREAKVRWVLLADIGQAVISDDVPRDVVVNVIEELLLS